MRSEVEPAADEPLATLLVLAKAPVPGRVKTRLVPPLTHEQAAGVAAAALRDTLAAADAVAARERLLAFDGDPDGWVPTGWRHVQQPCGGLDTRLVAAFAAAGPGPAVLVGMDTPQLCPRHVEAFDPIGFDACLGPARDGGYWAIGFTDPGAAAAAITGVPMSTGRTGQVQLARLRELGMRVQLLDVMTDVDTVQAAHEVARLIPAAAFTAALARTGLRG